MIKYLFTICLLIVATSGFAQKFWSEIPTVTPTLNTYIATADDGTWKKYNISVLANLISPKVYGTIAYIPTPSGNSSNRGQFVIDPNGARWYIDFGGAAITMGGAGSGTVSVSGAISGNGSSGDPLKVSPGAINSSMIGDTTIKTQDIKDRAVTGTKIAQGGASNGQVLKWNGSDWVPANDATGSGTVSVSGAISGDGSSGSPLKVSPGAINSSMIRDTTVNTADLKDRSVTGAKIAQGGASNGQVLKWNGSDWVPDTDNTGGGGGSTIARSTLGDSLVVGSSKVLDKDNPLNNPWYRSQNIKYFDIKSRKVAGGTGDLNVVLMGDSRTDFSTIMHKASLEYLKTKIPFKGPGYVGGTYDFYNISGSGPTSHNWTQKAANTGGGFSDKYSIISTNTSTDFNFYPLLSGFGFDKYDSLIVFYKGVSGGGTFSVLAGATTVATINTSLTSGFKVQRIYLGSLFNHTITIHQVSAGSAFCEIYGFNCKSSASGVLVHKVAQSGMSSLDYATLDSTAFVKGLKALNTDIVFFYLGVNDQRYNYTPSSYYTNMKTMVRRIKAVGPLVDIVLVAPESYDTTIWHGGIYNIGLYVNKLRQICLEDTVALFDNNVLFGHYSSKYVTTGIMADGLHETTLGAEVIVSSLFKNFTAVGTDIVTFYQQDGILKDPSSYRTVTGNGKILRFNGLAQFQLNNAANTKGVSILEVSNDLQLNGTGRGATDIFWMNYFAAYKLGNNFLYTDATGVLNTSGFTSTNSFGSSVHFGSTTITGPSAFTLNFAAAGSNSGGAKITGNGSGKTEYYDIELNMGSSSNNGAGIYLDSRDGAVAPFEFVVKPSGTTSPTYVGNVGKNGKWHLGPTRTITPAVGLDIDYTDAVRIPRGTTAQQPTGAVGMLRADTDIGKLKGVPIGTTFVDIITALDKPFVDGGNSFAAHATAGTNDTFDLRFKTNNIFRAKFDNTGGLVVGGLVTDEPGGHKIRAVGGMRAQYLTLDDFTSLDPNTNAGEWDYYQGTAPNSLMTFGTGTERKVVFSHVLEKDCIDYNVAWTTGRTRAFFTVPAKYAGLKIRRVLITVSSIGTGTNTVEIEKAGVTQATQSITAASHALTINQALVQDDVWTFNVTAIGGTPSKGLNIEIELTQ